ncbi:MAG: site-2 protease family protein [Acidobacteriota bacterium]
MPDLANGAIYYLVFLFSTTLHEAAHAWVAMRGGDLTAYHGGQVSLNPIPHIRREPIGMLVLPLLSVALSGWPLGFASAPFNPEWARRYPRRAAVMALAGPATNLLLVLLAAVAIRVVASSGIFTPPSSVRFGQLIATDGGGLLAGVAFLIGVLFSMNLLLAVLNLLPLPPLDGSTAIILFMSDATARRYQDFLARRPALRLVGILIAWQLFSYVFQPIFFGAVNLLYPGTRYG